MAFKELDVNLISQMRIEADFLVGKVPVIFLYYTRNDTMYVLVGDYKKYVGCFSGDNTFTFTETRESIPVSIDFKSNSTFERTFVPTYVSIITQLLLENKF